MNRTPSLVFVLAGLIACGNPDNGAGDDSTPFGRVRQDRDFIEAAWDTLFTFGSLQDSLLLDPARLEVGKSQIVIYDFAGHNLLVFDRKGKLEWTFGQEGRGPDDFADVRDIALDSAGRIFALDPENQRILILSQSGEVEERLSLEPYNLGRVTEFVPLPDGRIVLVTRNPSGPLAILNPEDQTLKTRQMPWEGFAALHPMVSQGAVGSSLDGRWVFGFSFGPGWFAFDGADAEPYTGHYVEPMIFPGVEQSGDGGVGSRIRLVDTEFAARDIAISDSTVYILYGGLTPQRFSLLDTYDWATGRYTGTYQLPEPAYRVGVDDGDFIVVLQDPYPRLVGLRPRGP